MGRPCYIPGTFLCFELFIGQEGGGHKFYFSGARDINLTIISYNYLLHLILIFCSARYSCGCCGCCRGSCCGSCSSCGCWNLNNHLELLGRLVTNILIKNRFKIIIAN